MSRHQPTAIPELCTEVPGAPRVETALYYVARAPFACRPVPLPPALPSDDLFAIATRAKEWRELHGDEAFQLAEGYELLAGQLEAERNEHQVTMLALDDAREELALVRRQLADAREQLLAAKMASATLKIAHVSYAQLTAEWQAQDAAEMADLERRQRLHDGRAKPRVSDDDTIVSDVEYQAVRP